MDDQTKKPVETLEEFVAKRREARKAWQADSDYIVTVALKMRNPDPIPFLASPMEPGFMFRRQAE